MLTNVGSVSFLVLLVYLLPRFPCFISIPSIHQQTITQVVCQATTTQVVHQATHHRSTLAPSSISTLAPEHIGTSISKSLNHQHVISAITPHVEWTTCALASLFHSHHAYHACRSLYRPRRLLLRCICKSVVQASPTSSPLSQHREPPQPHQKQPQQTHLSVFSMQLPNPQEQTRLDLWIWRRRKL